MNKQSLLILFLATSLSFYSSAQTTGDYRSNAATFNWDAAASWQRWDGAAWADPTVGGFGYPGENATGIAGTVTIQNGHTVTANVDVTVNDIGSLVINGTLVENASNVDMDMTGDLTIVGTFDINGDNCTFDVGGGLSISGNGVLNMDDNDIRLGVLGSATIIGNGVFNLTDDDAIVTIGGSLSLQNAAILNLASGGDDQDITVTGNLTMDATSQIQGNDAQGTIQINGTFTIPASATNARIGGVTLTVNGATTVPGTVTFNSNNGVKTFKGSVTVSGSWTSTAITSNNGLIFGGEIMTSGTFACGCN
ncbi:MAG TPA: hypothetical protein VFU05_04730 [Cyclobacteriaceae bacterium]|nr:hypothetical protein [Cyclobacteriaceae bacterium]